MARSSKSGSKSAPPPPATSPDTLRLPSEDLGLSLEELSEAYAALLGGGADPYAPAPPPDDGIAAGVDDAAVAAELLAADDSLDEEDEGDEGADAESDEPQGLAELDDACEISPRTILEAMLFVGHPSNEPLTAKQVASLMRGVLPREIDELIRELNESYDAEGTPYRIESDGPGYRLLLRGEFAGLREKFLGKIREVRLAQPVVDVLSIVAYHQPIDRAAIDRLRGAASGAALSQLVRRGLLRVEFADERGRRPLYYTTDRFLELFHLESLDDLPRSQIVGE